MEVLASSGDPVMRYGAHGETPGSDYMGHAEDHRADTGCAAQPVCAAIGGHLTWRNMFCKSKKRALELACENIQFEINDLRPFMRGADMIFNNNMNGIYSRAQMEMMAMGKPVVAYNGTYTPYIARIWDLDSIAEQVERCWKDLTAEGSTVREDTRKYAREF